MADIDDDPDHPTLEPGIVPGEWLDRRCIGTGEHPGPFADVGRSDSIAHLRTALAASLVRHALDDLDAGDLRPRAPRRFTQEISRYVFEHGRGPDGAHLLGIRYRSRLGDELVNWAIFEGTEPTSQVCTSIPQDDPALARALQLHRLTLK
jgi:hypothetical protein